MNSFLSSQDTIVALSTAQGVGAIAVIRLSGEAAFSITDQIFRGKTLVDQPSHTAHFGKILDGELIVDEVVATIFKAPTSFTKENVVEISCHGSNYIINKTIKLLLKNGARYARAGEFTQRAFMNGRFDLAQAEAVADLIASDSEAAHSAAINQMRGGFSKEIKALRTQLIHFASMIELELDFAEEDVEFADRNQLKQLITNILTVLRPLIDSFDLGNAIKNGIPTVIAGKPNAGKSTLLNVLFNEEKALVSDIAGTTRDTIEDEINIEGIKFRFIDTAGLRETSDRLEAMGIEKTKQKMQESSLILYLFDANTTSNDEIKAINEELAASGKAYLLIANKVDIASPKGSFEQFEPYNLIFISAIEKTGIEILKKKILATVKAETFKTGNTVVTNIRHYESLINTKVALEKSLEGLDLGTTGDLLAEDIRESLYHLGLITGEITTEDLLENIFTKFCIGK
ncbi:MAG: tRNA uridine-5-carboxymethylaminomethyl(34) synthesis GTPase MnmE [Cytophagales bacterium]